MKRFLILLALLRVLSIPAQIRISDFALSTTDGAAPDVRTACFDPDGDPCALLKLGTDLSGWTFDAGIAGILDVRYEKGAIWLFVPKSARSLSVSHPQYGVLRDWTFPESLEAGRTYTMKLDYQGPGKTAGRRTARKVQRPAPGTILPSGQRPGTEPVIVASSLPVATNPGSPYSFIERALPRTSFCEHFIDLYAGCALMQGETGFETTDQYRFGISYTWNGHRVGPYVSAATDFDGAFSILTGAAFRLTDPRTSSLDWQLYAGTGLIDGKAGLDAGLRFAWRSSSSVSKADIGVGCQFYSDTIIPNVSVGLYILGIPVALGIGLLFCAL